MNHLEKRIKEKFPQQEIQVLLYTKMSQPAIVKCKRCGQVYELVKAENFLRANKKCICRKCINNKSGGRLTIEEFQKKIEKLYPQENLTVLNYTLKNRPCSIKCNNCGQIYTLKNAESFYNRDKKRICKKCLPNKRQQIFQSMRNFEKWKNKQTSFSFDTIPTILNSKTLITGYCTQCGNVSQKTIYDYMRGRGCKYCKKNILKSKQDFQKEIGDEYTVLEYKGMDHRSKFKHNLCNFIYDANSRNYSCPRCKGSKGQQKIRYILLNKNINFEEQKEFVIRQHKLRVDFYLPDYDIILEYQGEQHFHPIDFFGGEETFKKQVLYDNYKRQFFKEKMIEISYLDYNNIEQKINDLLKTLKVHRLS